MDTQEKLELSAALTRKVSYIATADRAELRELLAEMRVIIARAENRLKVPAFIDRDIDSDTDTL